MGAEVLAGRSVGAVAVIHMREDAILKGGGNGKRKEKWVPSRDTDGVSKVGQCITGGDEGEGSQDRPGSVSERGYRRPDLGI